MIRTATFAISKNLYAVDLASLRVEEHTGTSGSFFECQVTAVWFRRRRRNGKQANFASIGTLWDFLDTEPPSAETFLRNHRDGHYGGKCEGRWDGESYWGNVTLDMQQQHLSVLRPMLDNHPDVPAGFDGWWTF